MIKPIIMAGFTLYTKDGTRDTPLHRLDGPAISGNGAEGYFIDGKLHNLNGKAVIGQIDGNDPSYEYWINGNAYLTEEEYKAAKMIMVLDA